MDKTAWEDENLCGYILRANFPPLSQSDHFHSLSHCIEQIEPQYNKLIDIGCCAAEFAEAFPRFEYCGADLPHMIEQVSKRKRPDLSYIQFHAEQENFDFCKYFDVVLMNGFLCELRDPLKILSEVLNFSQKYVVIHRQDLKDLSETYEKEFYDPYSGGIEAASAAINKQDFYDLLKDKGFKIKTEVQSYVGLQDRKSILLVKND